MSSCTCATSFSLFSYKHSTQHRRVEHSALHIAKIGTKERKKKNPIAGNVRKRPIKYINGSSLTCLRFIQNINIQHTHTHTFDTFARGKLCIAIFSCIRRVCVTLWTRFWLLNMFTLTIPMMPLASIDDDSVFGMCESTQTFARSQAFTCTHSLCCTPHGGGNVVCPFDGMEKMRTRALNCRQNAGNSRSCPNNCTVLNHGPYFSNDSFEIKYTFTEVI